MGGVEFSIWGEERGFSIPFFGNMGWRRRREREANPLKETKILQDIITL